MINGRSNIIAGVLGIVIAGVGAFFLGFTMNSYFPDGIYAIPLDRVLLKAGHTHAMPLALYNLIIGSLVDRLALSDKWKRRCSLFSILAFIMPIGLILRGMADGSMAFAPVVLIGAICFLASAVIVAVGAIKISND